MPISIGIATEQRFRYIELTDAKIWISKNASLCQALANRVTYSQYLLPHFPTHPGTAGHDIFTKSKTLDDQNYTHIIIAPGYSFVMYNCYYALLPSPW